MHSHDGKGEVSVIPTWVVSLLSYEAHDLRAPLIGKLEIQRKARERGGDPRVEVVSQGTIVQTGYLPTRESGSDKEAKACAFQIRVGGRYR